MVEAAGANAGPFSAANGYALPYRPATANQTATFLLGATRNTIAKLTCWRSRFGAASTHDVATIFERLPDLPVASGEIKLVVEPDTVYTLSTVQTANKAGDKRSVSIPPSSPFPLPFSDDFEGRSPPQVGTLADHQSTACGCDSGACPYLSLGQVNFGLTWMERSKLRQKLATAAVALVVLVVATATKCFGWQCQHQTAVTLSVLRCHNISIAHSRCPCLDHPCGRI